MIEFSDLFAIPQEVVEVPNEQDPIGAFLSKASLASSTGTTIEGIERIDRASAQRTAVLAEAAKASLEKLNAVPAWLRSDPATSLAKRDASTLLTKRSSPSRVAVEKLARGHRIEREFYPSGGAVASEFDENGVVVKTWIEA